MPLGNTQLATCGDDGCGGSCGDCHAAGDSPENGARAGAAALGDQQDPATLPVELGPSGASGCAFAPRTYGVLEPLLGVLGLLGLVRQVRRRRSDERSALLGSRSRTVEAPARKAAAALACAAIPAENQRAAAVVAAARPSQPR
jgi:hypothetical protein